MEEPITYRTVDDFRLVGLRAMPDKTRGWALMMHGITENKDEYGGFYADLARGLNAAGFGTLRFDFRGHGESSGTTMDISVLGDVLDIEASLGQMPVEPSEPIAFVGTSFGSGPAILAASETSGRVKCLSLIAPVLDYRRTFLEPETPWARQWFTAEAIRNLPTRGHILLEGHKLSPRLIEEFRFIRPLEVLAELQTPTLIIHGDRDTMVPHPVSVAAARSNPHVKLHTLVNADHGFSHFDDDEGNHPESQQNKAELIREAVNFVSTHLA
jgi:pimeloyl-ACP methyl ester carboxylesterase